MDSMRFFPLAAAAWMSLFTFGCDNPLGSANPLPAFFQPGLDLPSPTPSVSPRDPAPSVSTVSRNAGVVGNVLTVTGTGFKSGLVIELGSTACATSAFVSTTSATCAVPASASIGSRAITVTNSDGQSGTLAAAFTHLMNPAFWMRGDVATQSGGFVDSWTDLTGNGFHGTQSGATRPQYANSVASLNNHPALLFNGTSSALFLTTGGGILRNKPGLSWGAALTTGDNTQVQQSIWGFSTNTTGSTRFAALMNDTNTGTNVCDAGGFVGTSGRKIDGGMTWFLCKANAVPTNNTAFVASANASFTGNTIAATLNGTTVGSSAAAAFNSTGANTSNTDSAAARIGTGNTGSRFLNGYLAELVFYDYDIGVANRQALEAYLKTRYNIP